MAYGSTHEITPWRRSPLTLPPKTLQAWVRLAAWELWMGMLLAAIVGLGVSIIVSSPTRIVTVSDLSRCYAPPPVELPCERIVYRGGVLNAAFTALCGLMLMGLAAWFIWELWNAVEPKPITDDFLKLLNDSFGRDWRNPLTWPWARVFWAYGFTTVGALLTVTTALALWTLVTAARPMKLPEARVNTSQTFTVAP
jgi:hypothetical protein